MTLNRCAVKWVMTAALCWTPTLVSAEPWVDADGNFVTNPGYLSPLEPSVIYDPGTGIVSLINAGTNGVVDTEATAITPQRDDVGMISLITPVSDSAAGNAAERIIGGASGLEDGILWTTFTYFAGKVQLIGTGVGGTGGFVPISVDPIPLWRTLPGLDESAFGDGEAAMGLTFAPFTIFGGLELVPEPGCLCLIVSALLVMVRFRRRVRSDLSLPA